jgi:hypothetical protein
MSRIDLLKKYTKPIVHMRQQFLNNKFGLVFGSGVSKNFKLPHWKELIKRIADNVEVNGEEILLYKTGATQASVTQMLYEHFRAKELERLENAGTKITRESEKIIYQVWRNIIHKELWRDFKKEYLAKDYHPYIESFIDIIKNSTLTINYNFDDILQTLINERRTPPEVSEGKKLYETVYDARLQFHLNKGIIYHPNGFLPKKLIEGASENLVFSEDSFADQLIASMAGHYSTLLHHLSKNTCLFIGLSLDDTTLKHLLRQCARINPGHYHYYIAYTKDKNKISKNQSRAITEANFDLYNLITLFLDDNDLKNIGELIQLKEDAFEDECKIADVPRRFVYYLTGAVGCGKTTTLSYFRNMTTFSEWPEQRLDLLARPWNKLSDSQRKSVDKWIGEMFYKKNRNLSHVQEGITIIDRTPLDPLTFTRVRQWKQKANFLHDNISRGGNFRIVPGQIILLEGNKDAIASRVRIRQKTSEYDSKHIKKMYEDFEKMLKPIKDGVIKVDTTDLSIYEVVKRVAKLIHFEKYHESDLHSVLDHYKT